jgi:DNA modification methylase
LTARILTGDCRAILPTLDAGSVHCVVTSPPYFGLRDYGTAAWSGGDAACDHVAKKARNDADFNARTQERYGKYSDAMTVPDTIQYRKSCGKCGAVRQDQQIGLESSLDAYIAELVAVFRLVKRVLRDDGTCWLNLGSSYASATIESDEYIMRDDLTDAERAYVYAELAAHYRAESEALSGMRQPDAPAESTLPLVLVGSPRPSAKLRDEGV